MSDKAKRRAAIERVGAYHDAQLEILLAKVGDAIDRYRAGELDVVDTDHVIFHYSRAAKELWKFCNMGSPESRVFAIDEYGSIDWWEVSAPRRRS